MRLLPGAALVALLFSPAAPLPAEAPVKWKMPEPKRTVEVRRTIIVPRGRSVDYNYARLVSHKRLGDGSQKERQQPVLRLMPGASVRRVIIGAPGADGIHCHGRNLLHDVWFEDVGEDAVTVRGGDVKWIVGGARHAEDKIVQINHKGPFHGERLRFEDFSIAVRGNGDKRYRSTPFRVHLEEIGARDGRVILRLTSRKARGSIECLDLENVRDIVQASNGAKVKVRE